MGFCHSLKTASEFSFILFPFRISPGYTLGHITKKLSDNLLISKKSAILPANIPMIVCVRIKRYHVFSLELRPGGQIRKNSPQNETKTKSLALFLAEL